MAKKPRFRTPFASQNVKESQTLQKPAREPFYHTVSSLWKKCSFKTSLFLILEILGLFVNTLTSDDKYSFQNKKNLQQPIQMQLSKEQKVFSEFSFPNLKSTSNFELFKNKYEPHRLCISESRDCQIRG